MQNQNVHSWSWSQGAAAPFPASQAVLPTAFAPAGVDQNSLLTNYQQMYGTSSGQAPADYSQWTSAQFQQWQQWQQWQEKYQQWQAQYGKKYAESLAAMGQNASFLVPGFPSVASPVGVSKPVEAVAGGPNANPPLPANSQPVPPPPPEEDKPPLPSSSGRDVCEPSKNESKDSLEELTEAEKTFDIQFKQWESQLEEWKKQNQDHPDKAQYREYEKKWESCREQLLQRREQMRKKRLEKAMEAHEASKAGGKVEEAKGKLPDADYGYRTQPPAVPLAPFTTENKPPLFDKPPPITKPGGPSNSFATRGHLLQEKAMEGNRTGPCLNSQSVGRSQGVFGHFDHHQEGANPRFGSFEGGIMDEGFGQRFRSPGQFEGPRFGGGADNFPGRRFEEKGFGPGMSRPSGENCRSERELCRMFEGEKGPFGNEGSRQGPAGKPKVPSLFDIQVEKPPGLMMGPRSDGERKGKVWEKHEEYDKKLNEAKSWGGSPWPKNAPSPWMQPWEMEKLAAQKPQEVKPWERDGLQPENSPWLKDSAVKRDIDRAELSGYVGNILAKLGGVSVMPPNLGNKTEEPPDKPTDDHEKKSWNEGFAQKGGEAPSRSQNSEGNFRSKEASAERGEAGPGRPRGFDRFEETPGLVPEGRNLDVDDRVGEKFRRDGRIGFGRTGDRRNFGGSVEDRFFERGPFGRGGREEGGSFGGRFPREDVDERFGSSRNGRRAFGDRFDRDEREGRGGPFDRFPQRSDQLNEPVWKPQVFDYSQGRPMRLPDPEEGFRISTVVDYSHGEKKQTFDYGHGEGCKDRLEMKSFDYGHKADVPTVIDYGHGVDLKPPKDKTKDGDHGNQDDLKPGPDQSSQTKRTRSPRGPPRSRSRSPHSRFKRGSTSPPFKNLASRSRDRLSRQTLRSDRNCSEDKLSPSDGEVSKHSFTVTTVLVEDLICRPGRESRPSKLVFIMRGLPGSGKTYVTKLIKDKEVEVGGDPPRILSLDDYFMTEVEKETVDAETGRKVKAKTLEYEYEASMEPHYRGSLVKAFKKTVSDGFFSFIIVDSVNEKTKDYEEMWSFAKQKGFQVYVAEMDNDVTVCTGRNIHKRTEKEISELAQAWEETPVHYLRLDVRSLLQSDAITEVEMEVVSDTELDKSSGKEAKEQKQSQAEAEAEAERADKEEEEEEEERKEDEEEDEPGVSAFVKSRWDQFENSEQNLDRLDGLKRRREGFHATMEDYLQLPDEIEQDIQDAAPGKKRVRWADLEERKQQEKMRAIGFVVGQTDWSRMTDPTFGESALTRTKYI